MERTPFKLFVGQVRCRAAHHAYIALGLAAAPAADKGRGVELVAAAVELFGGPAAGLVYRAARVGPLRPLPPSNSHWSPRFLHRCRKV